MSSETTYWLKLGIIALLDAAVLIWIWRRVKRVDREIEANEERKRELVSEINDNGFQFRAREAESLDDTWDSPTRPAA